MRGGRGGGCLPSGRVFLQGWGTICFCFCFVVSRSCEAVFFIRFRLLVVGYFLFLRLLLLLLLSRLVFCLTSILSVCVCVFCQGLSRTPIDTQGFSSALRLMETTCADSFELFYGLFRYNPHSHTQLRRLRDSFAEVERQVGRLVGDW